MKNAININNNAAKNPFLSALLKGQEANLMVRQHAYAAGAAGANGTGQALDRLADAGQKVVDAIRKGAGECHKKEGEWAKKAEVIKARREGRRPVAAEPALLPAPAPAAKPDEKEVHEGFVRDVLPVLQQALAINPAISPLIAGCDQWGDYGCDDAAVEGDILSLSWWEQGEPTGIDISLSRGEIISEWWSSDED